MNKYISTLLLLLCFYSTQAQKVTVQESTETIEKIPRQGMYILLELDRKDVEKAWVKYLKNYGKTESSGGVITIQAANIPAISSTPCKIQSKVETASVGSKVWWGIDLGSKFVTKESADEYRNAEKMLYEFGINAYREDINQQIADAEKALEKATKVHEKEVDEGLSLINKIDSNKEQKKDLEEKLRSNKEEYIRLNRDIDNNLAEQKVALEHVQRIKSTQHSNEGYQQSSDEKKALSEAMKNQQKKINEGSSLAKSLSKNKQTKTDLESKLKRNESDLESYLKSQEQNKKDEQAALADVEKMKKALEVVKEKINRIE
jgi:DNA repair exonuclease SbcCD ATPase subunit